MTGTSAARTRLGRRIVLQFMLAVAVPLLVLGALTHRSLMAQAQEHAQRQLDDVVGHEAMRTLDRLIAARAALRLFAESTSETQLAALPTRAHASVFKALTRISAPGASLEHAHSELGRWWQSAERAPRHGLYWSAARPGVPARFVLALRDASGGGVWLGELEPSYLWADTFEEAGANLASARDSAGGMLYSVGPDSDEGRTAALGDPGSTLRSTKALFLGKEFGVSDWTFRAQKPQESGTALGVPLGGMVFKVVMAALLLVLVLSLVQIRYTMGPLQRLLAATRKLARQDYSARVQLVGQDEFRELGESFNDMASQMEEHVRELRMLSSIDREILESPDPDRLAAMVLQHLATLAPEATVALCVANTEAPNLVRCHLRRTDGTAFAMDHRLDRADWQALAPSVASSVWLSHEVSRAPWFTGLMGQGFKEVFCASAAPRGATQVALLIAAQHASSGAAPWRPRAEELRNRVAVAVAAAAHDRQLVHQATHDSLTGLHNRAGLQEALAGALTRALPFAVMFADLDRFKNVNDSMGHGAGDEVLRLAALRLCAALPEGAIVARPGGDEFVVLLSGPTLADRAPQIANAICETMADSFEVQDREVVLGASLGWAVYPEDGVTADELMRHADMAMYAAKDRGRGQAARFERAMDAAVEQQAWLHNDLRLAVERRQFVLHYQPRVETSTEQAHAAEALVRWQHPLRGMVSPLLFIAAAEDSGVIHALGRWVLREACRQLAAWRAEGLAMSSISVNVSALQLADPGLYDEVVAALEDHCLAPANLELEVTESVLVGDQNVAAAVLARLRTLGVGIALDDFGTGYSSMAYLSNMPVDVIKVDRAFVKNLGQDRLADTVTRAIVTLAHSLGLRLVAEGVETREQAEVLKAMGCQQLQGYLFSRPLPAADFARLACVGTPIEQQAAA